MSGNDDALDQIWADDLFDRRSEAQQLIGYIECAVSRPFIRLDKRAYTISVDAGYGEGKSFFLKRLSENLNINHPVAFVDAWADDLADEPLTALVATLKKALDPFAAKPEVQKKIKAFLQKSGKVARHVALGLLRRGLSLAITAKAVEGVEAVFDGLSDGAQEALQDATAQASSDVTDDISLSLKNVASSSLMEKRVAEFEQGQASIREMKDSLSAIVESIGEESRHPPIIIFIDELDRCRPTYAIKLLEEIKHLFDVPGLVFIMAMHRDQLGHSISGAYGAGFDGRAYLRRFIDREYRLAMPDLDPLLNQLCHSANLADARFLWPHMGRTGGRPNSITLPKFLSVYMRAYGLSARDGFELVDILQTCNALAASGGSSLWLQYLVPLIIGHMKGMAQGALPPLVSETAWRIFRSRSASQQEMTEMTIEKAAEDFSNAARMTDSALSRAQNDASSSPGVNAVWRTRSFDDPNPPIWNVDSYPRLLRAVSRFSNPQIGS